MIKNICAGLLILCQSTFDFQQNFEYNNNKEFIKILEELDETWHGDYGGFDCEIEVTFKPTGK